MKIIENKEVQFLLWLQNKRNPILNTFSLFITLLGNEIIYFIFAGFLLHYDYDLGLKLLLIMSVEAFVTHIVLKPIIKRERPFIKYKSIKLVGRTPKDKSWPSGHTATVFCFTVFLLLHFPLYIGIIALILAIFVAMTRMYLGVHYPTDVIGGILLSILINSFIFNIIT